MNEQNLPVPADRPEPVPLAVLPAMRRLIADLDVERQALADAGDLDALANGGSDLGTLIDDLRMLHRAVRADVARLVTERFSGRGKPRAEIPGLGVVEVESGSDWKRWDSERLLRHLVYGALVDDDGEIIERGSFEVADRIVAVLLDVLPIGPSTAWKRGTKSAAGSWTGLRGYGVDLDDYAERVDRDRLATLPRRDQ